MPEEEPFAPKPKPALPLDALSVSELEARIEDLKGEIAVCEGLINSKRGHLAAADALFGSKRT
jgi:uncharacterized small protein (DUF1192 family)